MNLQNEKEELLDQIDLSFLDEMKSEADRELSDIDYLNEWRKRRAFRDWDEPDLRDLMEKIDFSEEQMREVFHIVRALKTQNMWSKMLRFAAEYMSMYPCNKLSSYINSEVENPEQFENIHEYSKDLIFILLCSLYLKEDYEEMGIPLSLYYDTMKDITYKVRECQTVYEITGIFVRPWYDGFFDLERFAYGRLQFEMTELCLEEPIIVNGYELKNGDLAINIHIPSSGPLLPEEVSKSFQMMKEEVAELFEDKPIVFVIASWLLDQNVVELLPEGNMKDFVKRFHIVKTTSMAYFDDGWRIFGKDWKYCEHKEGWYINENGPDKYFDRWRDGVKYLPRNTRLQRAIADYLQQEKDLGYGYAVMIYQ